MDNSFDIRTGCSQEPIRSSLILIALQILAARKGQALATMPEKDVLRELVPIFNRLDSAYREMCSESPNPF